MLKYRFDVFSGVEADASWLHETVTLDDAVSVMEQDAQTKPGRYFIFDSQEHFVVAAVDSTSGPVLAISKKRAR